MAGTFSQIYIQVVSQYKAGKTFCKRNGGRRCSNSHSQIETVYTYIQTQEKHHTKQSFKDEYIELLNKFEIDYQSKYLFEWVE